MLNLQKVLLVDDSKDIGVLVKLAFKRIPGVQITQKFNGADAIAHLTSEAQDLILLDYLLEDETGIEVYQKLKSQFAQLPPVLFFTGMEDEEKLKLIQEQGATGILTKPFQPSKLLDSILAIISSKGL